ncbi:MAG: dihydrolipoyl dehydrogenase [Thermoprotei archaeon]
MQYDAVVIGSGPGGYVSAIRLGQLGMRTILIERNVIGGECTNYGCIPSKALIEMSNLYWNIKSSQMGIISEKIGVNFKTFKTWKDQIITKLRDGIKYLCEENGSEIITGTARIKSSTQVIVKTNNNEQVIDTKNIIIATGSTPIQLPNLIFDNKHVLSSKDIFEMDDIPNSLLIVGGGAIGIELGTALAKLGTQVTIVELMNQILPGVDPEIARFETRILTRLGIKIHTESTVSNINISNRTIEASIRKKTGEDFKVNIEKILVSVGRRPNSNSLGLENVGVKLDEKDFIIVDKKMRTNIPNIYAVGDVVGPPYLAHKAFKQGLTAAEVIGGLPSEYDHKAIPQVIYSDPEIALVGLSDQEAKNYGYDTMIGRFSFAASGRALTENSTEGFVKIIADKKTGVVLGAQMIGPKVSELISEIALAIEMGATMEDLGFTMHPHPTLSESIMEAAEDALGKPVHMLKRKTK